MAINLIIGGQIYVPGQRLTLQQMTAIQASIDLGTGIYSNAAPGTLEAQAYAQYVAQGGQQFIADAISQGTLPKVSTGDAVENAAAAKDDGATAVNPAPGQQIITPTGRIEPAGGGAPTNADDTPTAANTPTEGTNDEIRTISQTQAINNQSNRATAGAGQSTPDFAARDPRRVDIGGPGAGARGEDGTPASPSVVVNRLDALYSAGNNYIIEQPNVLDKFYSYTYSLSWYLVDPTAYNTTIQSIKKNLNGYYLLAQSGGITPAGVAHPQSNFDTNKYKDVVPGTTAQGAGRSPYFKLDYYIDNLTIETSYSNNLESGGPMAYTSIAFTVSEPNGLTLPWNLYQAVNAVYQQKVRQGQDPSSFKNYATGIYCMVIRFYGYNEQGQLVQPITNNVSSTDPQAAVEKFIFYQQTGLQYSVGSKLTEYKITGASPSTAIGFSSNRGSIPFNMQFTGTTVKDILVGQVVQQTASQAAGDQVRNGVPITSDPVAATQAAGALAAGTDPNAVNPQGMAFGGGGL